MPETDRTATPSRWFSRGAARQHYLDAGDGPPVLMLHGNPSWGYLWRDLVAALRGTHRCLVPDHIGMGRSDRPAEDEYAYTLASRVDDLDALTAHLVDERGVPETGWTLVLHDWGGPIGMAWAARHPGRVARLVVLNTAAFPHPFPSGRLPPHLAVALWAIRNTALARHLFLRHNAFARATARIGAKRRLDPAVRRAYLEPYRTPRDRLAILRFVQDVPLSPADPAWPELLAADRATRLLADRPVFIGWGGRDPVFRREFLDEWLRRFPGAVCRVYPGAGHYVLEDETEALVGEIRAFLA
ncbi:alpha/beta fold hydrolase [Saccharothrix syringae]|uniref:Alpha/beta fold hydrolase n=1 Tax=Saccharothrix syringae TaxID=103733 RepID=A0A5Q0GYF8_SACSY|nr:alpha/beta fold hydrolase [Saccharothrix syringae]QFZ18402.1 alpha/beta fold hydrolase [Saccharothrix syringae]